MTLKDTIFQQFTTSQSLKTLLEAYNKSTTIHLKGLVGGALSSYASAMISQVGGTHVFICEDRDAAAYLLCDFYSLMGEENIFFLPTSYKRSIIYGKEDANGIVQRTSTINRIVQKGDNKPFTVICTYPEALAERVVDNSVIESEQIVVSVGERIATDILIESIEAMGFVKVDFVYEPGQYSTRGGIIDIFSFSESRPYRIDLFGDDVDSIRRFNISNQLSYDKVERATILPNFNQTSCATERRVSFAEVAGEVTYWFFDADYALRKINDIRRKLLSEMEEPSRIDERVTSRNQLLSDIETRKVILMHDTLSERIAECMVEFDTSPQKEFNKNFEMLAADMLSSAEQCYKSYIVSKDRAQVERLDNILHQVGYSGPEIEHLPITLRAGFVDNSLKIRLFTDHQIFDRYQRYHIKDEIKRDEQMTIAELNSLKVGDYVVHYDHGVAKFGGLVKIDVNGTKKEVIKLIYKDQDLLFVNVHSLHCIARYKSGDGEPPKIYKLGGNAWQKLKNATKKAVKDISRELIELYAKRKASEGYAFSPDGYLQQELEASFMYEDTPDQNCASEAVKRDMESAEPMDRLVCGDVGFGKTEVAIRAAFKAATDGKQVAVLVPTTILAMQHYRSFSSRLRDFPVKIEYLNRTKSTREVNKILSELEQGQVDILIGTHKILGKGVKFKDLGLLVIDEEQKFGVAAKEKLTSLSVNVDTLTLTATPIPRTLQFSLMGSRDLSVISTPPPNRQPIVTESHIFSEEIIIEAIESELARGGQVYFVHNRVDDIFAIKSKLTRICPKARIAVGHGQMPPKELETVVMDFIYGEYDVLLATTIVENGIDVPNANTIIINNAHRFGLSALHQLRGRVGRSDRKAYCYLLSPPEELLTSDARHRLQAIEEFSDLGSGFNIAMQDLDIRGAGNLLGAEQSGFIANIGFETYQRIMQEAVAELRQEGLDVAGLTPKAQDVLQEMHYIEDSHIDVQVPASLPESYVQQSAERLKLYRELDSTKSDEEIKAFAERLVDRFGTMPRESEELLNVVRLRREAVRLGMERVKVKNGLMIVQFVGEQNSPYYQSDVFLKLLESITANPAKFVLRQNNNRLAMTVRDIKDIDEAYRTLKSL